MSSRTIKAAVRAMLEEHIPTAPENGKIKILERYPRSLDNAYTGGLIILWMRRGTDERWAGSGQSLGPQHGVRKLTWTLLVNLINWGTAIETDYDAFEDLESKILQIFRSNSSLDGRADDPEVGSQVLTFANEIQVEEVEPQAAGKFLRYQSIIAVKVEEIYNA